jgi:hypothetical protein
VYSSFCVYSFGLLVGRDPFTASAKFEVKIQPLPCIPHIQFSSFESQALPNALRLHLGVAFVSSRISFSIVYFGQAFDCVQLIAGWITGSK